MRLLHYSWEPISDIRSTEQMREPASKPRGLWVSVEGDRDWREWCEAEQFCNVSEQHCYEVKLRPDSNVLRLKDHFDMIRFTDGFGDSAGLFVGRWGIHWNLVAEKYAGIIIAPYQWSLRLSPHADWYYTWDCASGCIWNAGAIESIELVSEGSGQRTPAG